MRGSSGRFAVVAACVAVATGVAGCGGDGDGGSGASGGGGEGETLTIYNAQHEDLVKLMVDGFTKQTGIKVRMRNGGDLEFANQIVQEGKASPADVFLTENSPGMQLVDSKGLFAKVGRTALDQIPDRYEASDGNWVGFAARATTLAYNPGKVAEGDLPDSILDAAGSAWKGKVGYAPNGADFQAIVSAVLEQEGEARTKAWLADLKANATPYQNNVRTMAAVNAGEIETGIIYHYYWFQDQAEAKENSADVKLHFFKNQDPGAFTSVSGAGVLASSKHQAAAQKFLDYITGDAGQKILADSTALEYTLNEDVPANRALPPLASLQAPEVDLTKLNSQQVITLMQDAGIL
jgi:iron(III) transport system substrate-binding protein